jgi:hypothetical protein
MHRTTPRWSPSGALGDRPPGRTPGTNGRPAGCGLCDTALAGRAAPPQGCCANLEALVRRGSSLARGTKSKIT